MTDSKSAASERFLVLMRHGDAESPSGTADAERSLTAEGHAAMKHIGHGIERVLPRVRTIYSSPIRRAMQTAQWVSKAYRLRAGIKTSEALAPGASRNDFLELVETITERRAIVVGHAPNLREALFVLTGIDIGSDPEPGGCYGVRIHASGAGVLEWILPPSILQKLGE